MAKFEEVYQETLDEFKTSLQNSEEYHKNSGVY